MFCALVASVLVGGVSTAGRQKRFLYFNHETDMTVGLLVGVPISVTLPSLLAGYSWGRSLQDISLPIEADEETSDPLFPDQEDKLQTYFRHLQIPEGPCQDRILCEIAASPEEYFPASEILLKEVQPAEVRAGVEADGRARSSSADSSHTRLVRFLKASKIGFNRGRLQCKKHFRKCPVSSEDVFSRAGLKVWQWLASKFNISFRD